MKQKQPSHFWFLDTVWYFKNFSKKFDCRKQRHEFGRDDKSTADDDEMETIPVGFCKADTAQAVVDHWIRPDNITCFGHLLGRGKTCF